MRGLCPCAPVPVCAACVRACRACQCCGMPVCPARAVLVRWARVGGMGREPGQPAEAAPFAARCAAERRSNPRRALQPVFGMRSSAAAPGSRPDAHFLKTWVEAQRRAGLSCPLAEPARPTAFRPLRAQLGGVAHGAAAVGACCACGRVAQAGQPTVSPFASDFQNEDSSRMRLAFQPAGVSVCMPVRLISRR